MPEEISPEDASRPEEGAAPEEPQLGTPETWRAALVAAGLPDTLLAVADPGDQALDLTHAHPSGLATLLAGRPTPLSMLFREPAVHSAARRRSRSLRAVAGELASDRGVRAGLLTAGGAVWVPPWDPDALLYAPVLLRGCDVRPRGAGHDDYELELDDTAVVNPELLRRLREDHAVRLDGEALAELAFGIHGFDPDPVFRVLEDACAGVVGFAVEPRVLVGCFTAGSDALPAPLPPAPPAPPGHPPLRAPPSPFSPLPCRRSRDPRCSAGSRTHCFCRPPLPSNERQWRPPSSTSTRSSGPWSPRRWPARTSPSRGRPARASPTRSPPAS